MNLSTQDAIHRLEKVLLSMPQADIRTEHKFLQGIYERKITIPPWTVLTGAEHKCAYRVRLEKGRIAVNTDSGPQLLTAPCEVDVPAGIKRAGRVLEQEVVWVDIYPNIDNCRDLKTIEERLYVLDENGLGENRTLALIERDNADYAKFLAQIGMTQERMDSIVKNETDLIPMPSGIDLELKPSRRHGMGLFTTRAFAKDEVICPGRINGHRTPAGRFINHSPEPNVKPVKIEDDIHALAMRYIGIGEELLVDYRTSLKVNFGIEVLCLDG